MISIIDYKSGKDEKMEEKILKILKECCEDIEKVLSYDGDNMVKDGIIDSFTVIHLVDAIEEEFNIIIPARCILPENFGNKEMIVSLVQKVLEEKDQ